MESDPFSNDENDRISNIERIRSRHEEESLKNSNSRTLPSQELGKFSGDESTTFRSDSNVSPNNNQKSEWNAQDFDTSGKVSYGFRFHNDADQDGASLEMVQSSIHLSYTIPPKAGSKWFSSVEGESVFVKQKGFASTRMAVGYRILDGLSVLYDWGTTDGSSHNSYGMQYESGDTKTLFKIQYPRHEGNHTAITVQTTSKVRKTLTSHFRMGYNFLSYNGELFYSPIVLQLGLKTNSLLQEINQRLPQLSCSMDAFHKLPIQLDYIQPYPERRSSFQLGLALNRRQFQIQTFFTRFLSEFHEFSIGICHASWEGLSWILKWRIGDVCLVIPIQISVPGSSLRESVLYSLRCAYFGILSQTIHTVIGEVLLTNDREASNASFQLYQEQKLLEESKKCRIEAERQQMVMRKKAESNRRAEETKGGLVIENAVYAIERGDTFDVTLALQFWVTDSRLVLQGNNHTYATMLGFYDIRSTYKEMTSVDTNPVTDSKSKLSFLQSMKLLWETLKNSNNDDSNASSVTPYLHVRYRYNEKAYEVRVKDNQALVLPNPRAKAL